jgi:hypothetical protein
MKSGELIKRDVLILSNSLCLYRNEIWDYVETKWFGFTMRSLTSGHIRVFGTRIDVNEICVDA